MVPLSTFSASETGQFVALFQNFVDFGHAHQIKEGFSNNQNPISCYHVELQSRNVDFRQIACCMLVKTPSKVAIFWPLRQFFSIFSMPLKVKIIGTPNLLYLKMSIYRKSTKNFQNGQESE